MTTSTTTTTTISTTTTTEHAPPGNGYINFFEISRRELYSVFQIYTSSRFNFHYKLSIVFGQNGAIMGHVRRNVEKELEVSTEQKKRSNNMEEYAMDYQKEQTFVKTVQV